MMNFDKLPTEKPSGNTVADGTYKATVFKSEMRKSKNTNNEYLNVSFKLDDGGFVNENYFDSDKQFLMYKLGQLLKACKVTLSGEGTLKDVQKVIQGKRVIVDVAVNDNGYGSLDYSGNHEGIYPIDATLPEENNVDPFATAVTTDAEISEAIEAEVIDEDF